PATAVSPWEFRALTEVPTFPKVSRKEPSLWPGNLEDSSGSPRIPRRVSARRFFNIRNLGRKPSRDRLRFRGDPFESAIYQRLYADETTARHKLRQNWPKHAAGGQRDRRRRG